MYCLHCGREMTLTDGVYACASGGMALTAHLHDVFAERFPVQKPRLEGVVVGRKLAQWFCPGCGIPLERAMKCSACGQSIRDQIFRLVELPPHADESPAP